MCDAGRCSMSSGARRSPSRLARTCIQSATGPHDRNAGLDELLDAMDAPAYIPVPRVSRCRLGPGQAAHASAPARSGELLSLMGASGPREGASCALVGGPTVQHRRLPRGALATAQALLPSRLRYAHRNQSKLVVGDREPEAEAQHRLWWVEGLQLQRDLERPVGDAHAGRVGGGAAARPPLDEALQGILHRWCRRGVCSGESERCHGSRCRRSRGG
jgi:hypothetical protein